MQQVWEITGEVMRFIWTHLVILNGIFAIIIIFFQRRDPKTVWTWLLLLYFIPVLGFILYLFIAANAYAGSKDICFSIVRYGNVAGSRGSVIPFFYNLLKQGKKELPVTDYRMTRFWISLRQGVELVIKALEEAKGGETFISKIPSFKITDLAQAMCPGCAMPEIGIREGEKLHEIMVTVEDSFTTYEYEKHYIVYPQMVWSEQHRAVPTGKKVEEGFCYSSGSNTDWLSVEQIQERLKDVDLEK